MTREEAINLIADMDSDKYTSREAVALTMAIKALEDEDALEKIRAEILKSYGGFELGGFMDGYITAMVKVLNIIDKYKVESEGTWEK